MADQYDLKKEWPKIKEKLILMSKEAVVLAKKGEEQLVTFSKQGRLHIDSTTLSLKKDRLFVQIGKAYVKSQKDGGQSAQMKKLLAELVQLEKEERAVKRRLKTVSGKSSQGAGDSKKANK